MKEILFDPKETEKKHTLGHSVCVCVCVRRPAGKCIIAMTMIYA